MKSFKNLAMAGMLVVSVTNVAPVFADHWDHHHDHDNDFRRGQDWDRRDINIRVNDDRHYRNWRAQQAWSNDWNQQRTLYRNNWNHVSMERQRELDAQLRAQWLAYHHNNWNGDYNWNMYNDPRFLDYLHTSNPGLLGTLRNYIGL